MIWFEFLLCALLVILAATQLSRYGDVIAEKTGWGGAWVGAILLASVTSLPELVSGVSAIVWLDAPNLAIGSILGSCLFNLALIAVMDLVYQPGSILAKAQEGHILSAGFGVLLLTLVVAGALLGDLLAPYAVGGVSLVSLAIAGVYLVGARLIAQFERRRALEVLAQEAVEEQYAQISLRRAYFFFGLSALAIVGLGIWLSALGDRLSVETGLSQSFVGSLFLAVSTSLPEVAASLAAVRLGAIDLAVSNALGSNTFNILIFVFYDVANGNDNLWSKFNLANELTAMTAIVMTSVVIISLLYRASPQTSRRLNWDGVFLLGLYMGMMGLLYGLS